MNPLRPLALLLLSLALVAPARAADVVVEALDKVHRGELTALGVDQLTVRTDAGEVTLPLSKVVAITFGRSATTPAPATCFSLAGGDRYYGKLVDCEGLDRLVVDSASCGTLSLRGVLLTRIDFDVAPDAEPLPALEKGAKDEVILRNGDVARGTLDDLTKGPGGFTFVLDKGAGDMVDLAAGNVRSVRVQPFEQPKVTKTFHARVTCWDGTEFSARLASMSDRVVTFGTIADEGTRRVSLSALRSIRFRNGRFVYLSDLPWLKKEVVPYFDFAFEPRRDRCRRGAEPLRLRGEVYHKGIGMQSKTRLTYAVEGYSRFRSKVGIDDQAGDGGSVVFRVYLDDKRVHETPIVRGGGEVLAIDLPLKGAKNLTIEADYADNAHVNDLANWVEALLIK